MNIIVFFSVKTSSRRFIRLPTEMPPWFLQYHYTLISPNYNRLNFFGSLCWYNIEGILVKSVKYFISSLQYYDIQITPKILKIFLYPSIFLRYRWKMLKKNQLCASVCVCERERKTERERQRDRLLWYRAIGIKNKWILGLYVTGHWHLESVVEKWRKIIN
jgi:hypothetical protein